MENLIGDPILLVSGIIAILAQLHMGGIARDYIGAKGFEAYWIAVSPAGIFYYIEIKRKNKEKIGLLPWVYFISVVLVLYKQFGEAAFSA